METTTLIPRDAPIPQGRTLRFTFRVEFEVPVDEDLLDDAHEATLDEIEDWLGAGKHRMDSEAVWRHLAGAYDRNVLEHVVTLAEAYRGLEDDVRFEVPWEQRERLAGKQETWRSRRWLDALPEPSSTGAS